MREKVIAVAGFFIFMMSFAECSGDDDSPFMITTGREDTGIKMNQSRDGSTILDVTSKFGIDRAVLKRKAETWPKSIVVRLHLKGLESFRIDTAESGIEWSVASTGNHPVMVSLHRNGKSDALDHSSVFYRNVEMKGGNKIPLVDGYFEIEIPPKLLEGNPAQISLRWIDFFR